MSRTSVRRRLAAVVSVAALAFGGAALVSAPAAQAAPQGVTVSGSSLSWGIKASFRNYIKNIAAGSITASNGATRTGSGSTETFTWTPVGGTYDAATKTGTIDYQGSVQFRSTLHGIWFITIENPTIVLDGDSTGILQADVKYKTGSTESAPTAQGATQDVNFGDVTVTNPTVSGQKSTYTNQASKLTAAGSEAFGGFYSAGEVLDPYTAVINTGTGTTPPTTPPANPADPITALLTGLLASVTALLGSLGG